MVSTASARQATLNARSLHVQSRLHGEHTRKYQGPSTKHASMFRASSKDVPGIRGRRGRHPKRYQPVLALHVRPGGASRRSRVISSRSRSRLQGLRITKPKILSLGSLSSTSQRTRYGRARLSSPGVQEISSYWVAEIAAIAAQYDRTIPPIDQTPATPSPPSPFELFEDDVNVHWPDHTGTDAWREVWSKSDDQARIKQWPDIMLSYLRDRSSRTVDFLAVTLMHPLPQAYQVSDALDLMAAHIDTMENFVLRNDGMLRLFQLVCLALRRYSKPFPLSQRTVYKLSKNLDANRRLHLVLMLERYHIHLRVNTLLQLASHLARSIKRSPASLTALSKAANLDHGQKKRRIIQQICTVILRHAQTAGLNQTHAIVGQMLRLGIDMDIVHYNAIITNASEQGEYKLAWQVYRHLHKQGLSADDATFTAILKLCRRTNDFAGFRELYKDAHDSQQAQLGIDLEPPLMNELLYSTWAFETQTANSRDSRRPKRRLPSLTRALNFFGRHCDLQPLIDLGIVKFQSTQEAAEVQYRQQPSLQNSPVVYGPRRPPPTYVLITFIYMWISSQGRSSGAYELYRRFLARLHAQDPLIVPLAAHPFVWEMLMMRMGRSREFLDIWPQFMRTMVEPFGPHAAAAEFPLRRIRAALAIKEKHEEEAEQIRDFLRSTSHAINKKTRVAESDNDSKSANASADVSTFPQTSSLADFFEEHHDYVRAPAPPRHPTPNAQPQPIDPDTGLPFVPVKPTARTWNILAAAFARHNRPIAATKLISVLKASDANPYRATWNTVVESYARAGDPVHMLETLNDMQHSGQPWDRSTVRAVLRGRSLGRAMKAPEIARVGLGERVKGGGVPSGPRNEDGTFSAARETNEEDAVDAVGLIDQVASSVGVRDEVKHKVEVQKTEPARRDWWQS